MRIRMRTILADRSAEGVGCPECDEKIDEWLDRELEKSLVRVGYTYYSIKVGGLAC